MEQVIIERISREGHDDTEIPRYHSKDSAGFDLAVHTVLKIYKGNTEVAMPKNFVSNALANGHFFIRPHERVLIGCGFKVQLPAGKQLEVRPRSGTTLKRGLTVINSPGTVDNDYRGEVGVIILNTTPFLAKIEIGERLAQGVIMNYEQIEFVEGLVDETARGEGGLNSTGTK